MYNIHLEEKNKSRPKNCSVFFNEKIVIIYLRRKKNLKKVIVLENNVFHLITRLHR